MKTYEEIFEDNTEETLVNEIDPFENPELAQLRADTLKWFKDFEAKVNQNAKNKKE